jgi:hypothetical protein
MYTKRVVARDCIDLRSEGRDSTTACDERGRFLQQQREARYFTVCGIGARDCTAKSGSKRFYCDVE